MQRLGWFLGMTLLLVVPSFGELYASSKDAPLRPIVSDTLESGVILKTSFEYKTKKRTVRSEKRVFLADRNSQWLNLTHPREGIVLLGRMLEHDAKKIKMEYLVIDTNKENAVLATPVIETPLGKKSIINLDSPREKITLSLISKSSNTQ